jgi:hypothetical protein
MKEGTFPGSEEQVVPVGDLERVDNFEIHVNRKLGSYKARKPRALTRVFMFTG